MHNQNIVIINYGENNYLDYNLSNDYIVKQYNFDSNQIGKYFNKFPQNVLDDISVADYIFMYGDYINDNTLNCLYNLCEEKLCNSNVKVCYPFIKLELINNNFVNMEYNLKKKEFVKYYLSGMIKNIILCMRVKNNFIKNEIKLFNMNLKTNLFIDNNMLNQIENQKNMENDINYPRFYLGPHCSNGQINIDYNQLYKGKVRDMYNVGINRIMIDTTDRVSAFDKVCGSIYGKGKILNNITSINFKKTKHIVPNHYLYNQDSYMIVRKCVPIKLEVIIRQYLTGSLWNLYNNKGAEYVNNLYGINLEEGLQKNQKFKNPIITPTTKDEHDSPISPSVFTDENNDNFIVNKEDWEIIKMYSLNLFNNGTEMFSNVDLLLVDTKYEFGRDIETGQIILIDELHTPDSSRFWNKNTYEKNYQNNVEQECYDKQFFRNWLIESKNKDMINQSEDKEFNLNIPDNIKSKFIEHYDFVYKKLCAENEYQRHHSCVHEENQNKVINNLLQKYYMEYDEKLVVMCAGSTSDKEWIEKIGTHLNKVGLNGIVLYGSAHKNTSFVLNRLQNLYKNNENRKLVFVTVAGRSNALSGVVACNVSSPVIACPPFKDKDDMMVNINSTLVMPSDVPTMTILEPRNVALSVKRIFNTM